ncbi:hypothetical protein C8P68_102659 [Mucilaginibacter yixingensis]|uniref:YXWGXW repeat-containing protein n=1 Tax=Mucilaginibacter yixingensis TaxID=1295612 RepID=A0A2T5JDI5_9SPHI|nr:DUF6600 domain-containing protein [Mucilaginibacter yixingensis]PTQ99829.1 hypothetical protein C8P68_102659 [Mucilaginibacter yixingensis]
MKKLSRIIGTVLMVFTISMAAPQKSLAQYGGDITFQDFYDELAPYGTWLNDPKYGDVWVPDAGADFRPYATDGHWAETAYGNTWVSDFDWGWAPFHYGRWYFDEYYGWEWVPGYEWGPAWVDWRETNDYYGWAPMGPGVDVDMAFGDNYSVPDFYWTFAPQAYICSPYIYNYYVPRTRVVTIIRGSRWIRNDYRYNDHRYVIGPRLADVRRVSRDRVVVYNINNTGRPGATRINNDRAINFYRPAVRQDAGARPQRVVDARAYRTANPNQGLVSRGRTAQTAGDNRTRFTNFARTAAPDNHIVRENRPNVPRTDRQPTPVTMPGRPPVNEDQRVQRQQPMQQQQQQDQQRQNDRNNARQQMDQRRQQFEQQRQQRMQGGQQAQPQQQPQQQQAQPQNDQQRQQQWQQRRQQMDQQRSQQTPQQNDQQRQQADQARQQQTQQQQQQRQQQADQARQQQTQQQRQQQQQQADQARQQQMQQQRTQQQQQADQARQQQMQQQRAQQQQQADQARQQQQQQRQQQAEQQRQQQQQQQQQRQQQAEQQRQQQQQQQQRQRDQQDDQRARPAQQ